MEYLLPIFICILAIVFCYSFMRLSLIIANLAARYSVLRAKRIRPESAAALLATYFGTDAVLTDGYYPSRTPKGTRYESVPYILVYENGIAVIEFCDVPGTIQNSSSETWTAEMPRRGGKTREVSFENPIQKNENQLEIISSLLKKLGKETKVIKMTVFTSPRAVFESEREKDLYLLPEAIKKLTKKSAKPYLSEKQQAHFLKVLKKYSLSRRQAIAKNNSLRRKRR